MVSLDGKDVRGNGRKSRKTPFRHLIDPPLDPKLGPERFGKVLAAVAGKRLTYALVTG
jgi:hypothetical protein